MVRYVTEEVSRVKALFQEREAALTQERDSASHSSLAATQECAALSEKLSSLRSQLQASTPPAIYNTQSSCFQAVVEALLH